MAILLVTFLGMVEWPFKWLSGAPGNHVLKGGPKILRGPDGPNDGPNGPKFCSIFRFLHPKIVIPSAPNTLLGSVFRYPKPTTQKPLAEGRLEHKGISITRIIITFFS